MATIRLFFFQSNHKWKREIGKGDNRTSAREKRYKNGEKSVEGEKQNKAGGKSEEIM